MNEIKKLKMKKEEILKTLSEIEKGYKNGFISKEEFIEIKRCNEKKIVYIDREIRSFDIEEEPQLIIEESREPEIITKEIQKIKPEIDSQKKIIDKLDNFTHEINSIKNLMKDFKSVSKPNTISKENFNQTNLNLKLNEMKYYIDDSLSNVITVIQLNDKIYQNIKLLSILSDKREIIKEMRYLENNIQRIRKFGFWDEKKRDFILKLLTYFLQEWREDGYHDLVNICFDLIKRMGLVNFQGMKRSGRF